MPRVARVRAALLGVTAVLVVVLLATALSAWRGAAQAADLLARGQADRILVSLQDALEQADGPPGPALLTTTLADLLVKHADEGLTWVAALTDEGQVLASAGAQVGTFLPMGEDDGSMRVRRVEGRVEVVRAPPGPPGPPGLRGPPGPPPLVLALQFEPLLSRALLDRARLQLGLSSVLGVGLLLLSVSLLRTLTRSEALEQQALEQRHLAALGQLSAVMAHEIRNPLASLKGHAQLLEEVLEGKARDKAGRVVLEAVRLEALTTALLDYAGTGELHREALSPETVVRRAIEEVAARRGVTATLTLSGAPGRAWLDPVRFTQLVGNLVDNAAQATPEGAAPPEVLLGRADEQLLLVVTDHGPGIPPELEARLFEPFFTTRLQGTGLGLAVVKRVVDLHGGTVAVDGRPERGARFTVCLPNTQEG